MLILWYTGSFRKLQQALKMKRFPSINSLTNLIIWIIEIVFGELREIYVFIFDIWCGFRGLVQLSLISYYGFLKSWEGHRKLKNQGNCYSYIIKRVSSNSKTLIEKTSWQLSEGRKTLRVEHFYVWKVKMVCRPIKGKGNFLLNLLLNHEKRPLEFSLSKNYFRRISFILHGSWPTQDEVSQN